MSSSHIVHIAIKVMDLEAATKFYTEVFGFKHVKTGHNRSHISRHMTDGHMDFTLMVYDSEDADEAQLAGPGSRFHHWGVTVEDQAAAAEKIKAYGGEILSPPGTGTLKFRAPDGTIAEVVKEGRYDTSSSHTVDAVKQDDTSSSRIVHVAVKVMDLEAATKFYTEVFGFKHVKTGHNRSHISRHMTDGHTDFTLMLYDSEDADEAQFAGPGSRLHHWGVTVADQAAAAEKIKAYGGEILSPPGTGALKFRAPDGTIAEVVKEGRYDTK
jgi:lactoylglutathione lyase